MSDVLVTGGAGFIGSHLCDALLERGKRVIVADKLVFGDKDIQHLINNHELLKDDRFKFYKVELSDEGETEKIFVENTIESVYHMAANSDIQMGGLNPAIDFNDTLLTTRTLLECMRKADVKNLFFASTSAIYGEMTDVKLTETTGGTKPVSYYGGAKMASEALISSYTAMCDMSVVIFRFPNVIGPRLTHGAVFDFMKKLQNDPKELEILGNGKQCKPYIYVADLIDAIIQRTTDFKVGEEVFNISVEGEGTEVSRIAEIVVEEMGLSDVTFRYTGGDRGWKGDVPRFSYDISKIFSTGWKPKYTSDEAVRQTVRDCLMKEEKNHSI